jgi:hypothetical protein
MLSFHAFEDHRRGCRLVHVVTWGSIAVVFACRRNRPGIPVFTRRAGPQTRSYRGIRYDDDNNAKSESCRPDIDGLAAGQDSPLFRSRITSGSASERRDPRRTADRPCACETSCSGQAGLSLKTTSNSCWPTQRTSPSSGKHRDAENAILRAFSTFDPSLAATSATAHEDTHHGRAPALPTEPAFQPRTSPTRRRWTGTRTRWDQASKTRRITIRDVQPGVSSRWRSADAAVLT